MESDLLQRAFIIGAGLLVASGVAAALFALFAGDIRFFVPAFAVISFVALVIGLPTYLAARAARRDTPLVAAGAGFAAGAIIPTLLVLFGPSADQASVGGTPTVVDGAYTAAGWLQNLAMVGFYGLLGLFAGLVFWLIVRRRSPVGPDEGGRRSSVSRRQLAVSAIIAGGMIAAAFVIPYATADRSCHNPLGRGGDSILPVAGFDLQVGPDQWRNVAAEVDAFGRSGPWSVRSDVRPDESFRWLQISLCKESGTLIFVQGLEEFDEVSFSVYQPQGGASWQPDFRALYDRLHKRWPSRIAFTNDQSQPVSAPEWATDRLQP